MKQPKPKDLRKATGISQSYASMILAGDRTPARPLAIEIYRKLGWKHPSIARLTDQQIDLLETIEPYSRAA